MSERINPVTFPPKSQPDSYRKLFGANLEVWEFRYPVSGEVSTILKTIAKALKREGVHGVIQSLDTQTDHDDEDYFLTTITIDRG